MSVRTWPRTQVHARSVPQDALLSAGVPGAAAPPLPTFAGAGSALAAIAARPVSASTAARRLMARARLGVCDDVMTALQKCLRGELTGSRLERARRLG